MRLAATALGLAALTALAESAGAQNVRDDREFFRPTTRQWSLDASISSLFDTNIDRDELEQSAQGVESGFVVRYRDRGRRHRFWVRYQGGAQFYNHSDRWDGGRSSLEAVFERNVGSKFIIGGIGGHSLRVSSDDRELTHKLAATPLVELELTRSTRLLAYGGFELRRPTDVENTQRLRTAGAEVATELGDVSLLRLGYRYETSASERSSRRYERHSYVAGYDADFGRNVLRFEIEYRERRFPDRLVEIDTVNVPRLDARWTPSASWAHEFPSGHRLRLKYEYEARASNDPSKVFRGHRLELSFRVPLTGRVAVRPGSGGSGIGLPAPAIETDEIRLLSEHERFRQIDGGSFGRGSDWKDVLQAQGVPANIAERPRFYEELWFYGDSWVVLKQGRVISWHDAGNLKLDRTPARERTAIPEPVLRERSRLETISEALTQPRVGRAAGNDADGRSDLETPSTEAARIAPSEIILKDGTRFPGRIQKYEGGLAYIIIVVGPREKSLLTTLPEGLIDKEATKSPGDR